MSFKALLVGIVAGFGLATVLPPVISELKFESSFFGGSSNIRITRPIGPDVRFSYDTNSGKYLPTTGPVQSVIDMFNSKTQDQQSNYNQTSRNW